MTDCKYCQDEVCVNADCPMRADFCPVVDFPGVCRFEDRGGEGAPEKADALHIVHCVDCKHKYFKDFSAFCPHRCGPLRPGGYCERGESEEKDG